MCASMQSLLRQMQAAACRVNKIGVLENVLNCRRIEIHQQTRPGANSFETSDSICCSMVRKMDTQRARVREDSYCMGCLLHGLEATAHIS